MFLNLFTSTVLVWWKYYIMTCYYYPSLPNSAFSDITLVV